jgi:hypothetical protein
MSIPAKSRKILSASLLFVALLALASVSAPAQVLYDNGEPALMSSNGFGWQADTNDTLGQTEVGDVFSPTQSGIATSISFGGVFAAGNHPGTFPSTSNTFTISLYAGTPDASATPIVNTLTNFTVQNLGIGSMRTVYEFTATLSTPLTLTVGSSYFLGITDTSDPYEDFAVVQTNNAASSNGYYLSSGSFHAASLPLSFALSAPEPSQWTLMPCGALVLLAAGRWARRRL